MKFNQILDSFANVELASLKHLFSKYDFKYDCILPMPMHLHLTWKKTLHLEPKCYFNKENNHIAHFGYTLFSVKAGVLNKNESTLCICISGCFAK